MKKTTHPVRIVAPLFISLFILATFTFSKKENPGMTSYSYLALGDSYTIGESVLLTESFPYQTVEILRKKGLDFYAPEIIAKTGWTTDELQSAINAHQFRKEYDFVTLLIGVNNQYRGRSTDSYRTEFESLLKQAISFAGGKSSNVIVISIPDWGVTPFAEGRDRRQIAKEIDQYNAVARQITDIFGITFIDITPGSRNASSDPSLVAADGLHPSAAEYKKWAERTAAAISGIIDAVRNTDQKKDKA